MIGAFLDLMVEAFKKTFPDLLVASEYPRTMAGLKPPALVFELVSADAAESQPATGQLDLVTRWEARFVVGGRPNVSHRIVAREAAVKLASFIHGNTFGIPSSLPARFARMADDGGDPELPTLEVWVLEWSQVVRVGKDLNDDGTDWLPQRIHIVRDGEETTYPTEAP